MLRIERNCNSIPQGNVLGPVLYLLYTRDIAKFTYNIIASFADDTAILATYEDQVEAVSKLQISFNKINEWTNSGRINLVETTHSHVSLSNIRYLVQIQQNIWMLRVAEESCTVI